MCGGGAPSPPDNSAQLALQRQQIEESNRRYEADLARAQAREKEQRDIANAPPAPAPNPTAMAPAPALEIATGAVAPTQRGAGMGRKRLRSDIPGAAPVNTLNIG